MYSFTNKHSKVFGYVSVLFTGLGFTIVSPVLPFLTLPYSHSIHQQAFYIKYRIFAFWFRKFDMDVVPWSYH